MRRKEMEDVLELFDAAIKTTEAIRSHYESIYNEYDYPGGDGPLPESAISSSNNYLDYLRQTRRDLTQA